MLNDLLRRFNWIYAAIEEKYHGPGVHVDFSRNGTETKLNRLFEVWELERLLKRQNYMGYNISIFSGIYGSMYGMGGRNSTDESPFALLLDNAEYD